MNSEQKRWQELLDDRVYTGATRNWDDVRFVEQVRRRLNGSDRLLDFGAGRGKDPLFDFRADAATTVGVDVDQDILLNEQVDEKHIIEPNGVLPFPDNTFDLICSANVFEHLADPKPVMLELARVLKPGGLVMAKTTNRNHYVASVARLTPFGFHRWYNKKRGREVHDTFETTYRCNSARQVRAAISGTSLVAEEIVFWEGRPEYLRFSLPTYLARIAYERMVNSTGLLQALRAVMVVTLRKLENSD